MAVEVRAKVEVFSVEEGVPFQLAWEDEVLATTVRGPADHRQIVLTVLRRGA